jgi:hypothetical protein
MIVGLLTVRRKDAPAMARIKRMPAGEVVEWLRAAEGADLVRESLRWQVQEPMETEVSEQLGASEQIGAGSPWSRRPTSAAFSTRRVDQLVESPGAAHQRLGGQPDLRRARRSECRRSGAAARKRLRLPLARRPRPRRSATAAACGARRSSLPTGCARPVGARFSDGGRRSGDRGVLD